ncbi:ATP-NAD kinase-like domain-containing protein [Schizothecium vesticola]|uniref:ATP-NAD kinase-like domain-containing protein n=1 Tax=Schizothecium vesticola TaxID=314040 RepID=A0AA40ER27_9PEZI|nr:ATP-NAD kinase-like domain-containing protein [Schizothecium vesticola]
MATVVDLPAACLFAPWTIRNHPDVGLEIFFVSILSVVPFFSALSCTKSFRTDPSFFESPIQTAPKMAIHMPRNAAATDPLRPTADSPPLAHPVNGEPLYTAAPDEATAIDEIIINPLQKEEIIFIRKAPSPSAGFLIYRLLEASPSEDRKPASSPFTLSVLSASHLPDDLSDLLIADTTPAHLRSHVDVIVSTRSGTGQAPCFYEGVLRPLLEGLGLDAAAETEGFAPSDGYRSRNRYRLVTTTSPRSVTEYAVGLGDGERTVILLSGDGGVVDLLNGLDQSAHNKGAPPPPTIALLPLGTGNALFHSLHKPHYTTTTTPSPSPLTLALRTLVKGTSSALPTFKTDFSPGSRLVSTEGNDDGKQVSHLIGAIVASYGFHAQLVWESDTPAYRAHGDKRFGMAAGELLKEGHVYDASLGVKRRGEGGTTTPAPPGFTYILATLVSNLERTFTISPASRPLDGRLRVVHFGDVGGGERTMEIMMAAYRGGEHVGMEGVGGEDDEVEEVRVEVREKDARWRKVCVDGTIVEVEEGGWFVVRQEREGGRVRILRH